MLHDDQLPSVIIVSRETASPSSEPDSLCRAAQQPYCDHGPRCLIACGTEILYCRSAFSVRLKPAVGAAQCRAMSPQQRSRRGTSGPISPSFLSGRDPTTPWKPGNSSPGTIRASSSSISSKIWHLPGGLHVSGISRPDTGLVTGLHATTDMALTVMRRLADGLSIALQRKAAPPPAGLRRRDGQILALLARGLEMKQVARLLDISPRTVAFYKYRAMEENDLKTREGLVNFALLHCCPELVARPVRISLAALIGV